MDPASRCTHVAHLHLLLELKLSNLIKLNQVEIPKRFDDEDVILFVKEWISAIGVEKHLHLALGSPNDDIRSLVSFLAP